jgi:subtilisin family serine protease
MTGVLVFASGGNAGSGLWQPLKNAFQLVALTPIYNGPDSPTLARIKISWHQVRSSLTLSQFSVVNSVTGGGILSTMLTGYGYKSGSSMSSPYAAAVAALVKSAKPSLTNVEIRALLENTATDLGEPGKVRTPLS